MRIIIGFLVFLYVLNMAFVYGGIWDLQENPQKNVSVIVGSNDEVVTGILHREWDKTWVLTKENGVQAKAKDFVMIGKLQDPYSTKMLWTRWRLYVPVGIVVSLLGGFLLKDLVRLPALLKG
jgi:hypothetical protein